jgi:hypothetical protein
MTRSTARLAATVFFGGTGIYADLPTGARFKFPTNAAGTVCTKTKDGWYTTDNGGKFRTGMGTAVITLPEGN